MTRYARPSLEFGVCGVCKAIFPLRAGRSGQLYCSAACREAQEVRRQRDRRARRRLDPPA